MYLDPNRLNGSWDTIPARTKVSWPAMATNPESTGLAPPTEYDHQGNSKDETLTKLAEAGDERAGDERAGDELSGDERAGDELAQGLETIQGPKSPED